MFSIIVYATVMLIGIIGVSTRKVVLGINDVNDSWYAFFQYLTIASFGLLALSLGYHVGIKRQETKFSKKAYGLICSPEQKKLKEVVCQDGKLKVIYKGDDNITVEFLSSDKNSTK